MPDDPTTTAATEGTTMTTERWYITTDLFANGGEVYYGWGPFATRDLALNVRALVERVEGRDDLCVDKR